jgi:MFS family permease
MRFFMQPSRLRRNLRASLVDGAAFSVMVGAGETYLPAFVLAMGMGEVVAGLVATVPLLAGAVLQLASPAAVRLLGSHRLWVVLCAAIQAASFFPLAVAAYVGRIPAPAIFLIAAVYWGAGLATGPAWNTWVGTIIPSRIRTRYFARRTRLSQLAVLVGFLGAGITLETCAGIGRTMHAFCVLFVVAGVSRLVSAHFLARQSEPVPLAAGQRDVPVGELIGRFRQRGDARLLLYMLSVQTGIWIAAPYFTPYMLRQLTLDYSRYAVLIAAAYVARIVSLPLLGSLAHRFGALRLLWIGGTGIVPLAGLWIVSESYLYLLVVQLGAGVAWAAYELATFLLFFETIPEDERTSVLTTFNLANASAQVSGSVLGGVLLNMLGENHAAYYVVFGVSSVVRALTLLPLARVVRAPSEVVPMATRTVAVRPSAGGLDQPVLASLPHADRPHHSERDREHMAQGCRRS